MKNILLLLLTFFCCVFVINSFAQNSLPPILQFEGIQPQWIYLSKDSNFVKESYTHRSRTPYNSRFHAKTWVDEEDLYLFEASSSNKTIGTDGFLIHKLHKRTGEPQWICHLNEFTGNKYQEDYVINPLVLYDENRNLVVYGMQSKDTIIQGQLKVNYESNIIKRTIDSKTGVVLDEKVGIDTVRAFHSFAGLSISRLHKTQKGELLKMMVRIEADSVLQVNPLLYRIDEDLIVDPEPAFEYPYDLELTTDVHSFEFARGSLDENDNYIVFVQCINRTLPRFSDNPVKSLVLIFSPDERGDYHLAQKIDLTSDFYRPNDIFDFNEFGLIDGKLIHFKTMEPLTSPVESELISWCYVYDLEGQLISSANLIYDSESQFVGLRPIGLKNDKFYVSMYYLDEQDVGSAIIEIAPGQNNWKEVGRIKVNTPDIKVAGLSYRNFLDGNSVYSQFGTIYIDPEDGLQKNALYYTHFDLTDLGITSSTQQEEEASLQVKLYPNPATETIIIDYSGMEQASLIITDLLGQVLNSSQPIIFGENTIDISSYPPGIYFYSLESKNKILTRSQFIKVE